MDYRIGVDFDNTLICYDRIIYDIAVERGLIWHEFKNNKRAIRDKIRQLPNGELEWRQVQAIAYGLRIEEGILMDGLPLFFELCKLHEVLVYVVSHKTEYASDDGTKVNLRWAALNWMQKNHFFGKDGFGLSQENVYFEATRREKVERIGSLRCTHFIDDLEETFGEGSFRRGVEKILYAPCRIGASLPGVRMFDSWQAIGDYLFHGTRVWDSRGVFGATGIYGDVHRTDRWRAE